MHSPPTADARRSRPSGRASALLGLFALLLLSPGCVVTQPAGSGRLSREVEPTLKRGYWLYLPSGYMAASETERRAQQWPLVVTFHGMKPFDNAHPQAREWQFEADRYGFVVIAPELRAPDVLGQFPVRTVTDSFRSDEQATLAILDHVFATTDADPRNVLSTSWSSGGYIAHYMLNRHPDRFTTLAVRQSNFSSTVLDPQLARRGASRPVLIVNTQNDFAVCKEESRQAIRWYDQHGYRNLAWVIIKDKGHERTPDLAADFFGRVAGKQPNSPNTVLARRQAIDGNPNGIALLSGRGVPEPAVAAAPRVAQKPARTRPPTPSSPKTASTGNRTAANAPVPPPRISSARRTPTTDPNFNPRVARPNPPQVAQASPRPAPAAASSLTPDRSLAAEPRVATPTGRIGIRVSSAIGIEPLHLGFSAECPASWYEGADFHWTINGEAIGNGVNGQKTLARPGEYALGLLVLTADGAEHRAQRLVRVLPRLDQNSTPVSAGRVGN